MTALTGPGWPRPIIAGWPIPWVSEPADLANMDDDRHRQAIDELLCSICGRGHEPAADVYFCVAENELVPRPGHLALAMDDSVMHERCAKLALGRCPGLRRLARGGELTVLRAKREHVEVRTDGMGHARLCVEAANCEAVRGR